LKGLKIGPLSDRVIIIEPIGSFGLV